MLQDDFKACCNNRETLKPHFFAAVAGPEGSPGKIKNGVSGQSETPFFYFRNKLASKVLRSKPRLRASHIAVLFYQSSYSKIFIIQTIFQGFKYPHYAMEWNIGRHDLPSPYPKENTMIAMCMLSTNDKYRNDQRASAPVYPAPAYLVRHAMLHVLSRIGLGLGGVAAVDEDEGLGIG